MAPWGKYATLAPLAAVAFAAASALSAPKGVEVAPQPAITGTELKSDTETSERHVDAAALSAQERSISTLTSLLNKYRGSAKEAVFLAKLGELKQENAAIRFRLAHGEAHRGRKAVDLTRYHKELNAAISTFSELIKKYPDFEEIPSAYFRRGKSYEEIGKKGSATLDYLHLVKHFADAPEVPSAYMALAEFSIEANDHQKAVGYLKEVEKVPDSPHFPFALYKLAWAHYNLRRIPEALGYAEKQIKFYGEKAKADGVDLMQPTEGAANSDYALRENTLLDAAVFYLEGFEQDAGRYGAVAAYDYFKKLEQGPILGRMILRFAKLLRSHVHEKELNQYAQKVLKEESARPESLDTLLVAYDFQLNRRRFGELVASTQAMVELHQKSPKFEAWDKARKALLDTADEFQKAIVKNKKADGVKELSQTLASVYDSFTRIVDEFDARIPRVHYNLAETLFTIDDFDGATTHYRWVVDHGSWSKSDPARYKVHVDSSLRAIAARYEVLRKNKQIPETLTAVSYATNKDTKLDGRMGEWVDWIDTHISNLGAQDRKETENFAFEASRALYSQGRVREAATRMKKLALANPASEYAVPAASLVVDTEIATGDWERVEDLARDFLKIQNWKGDGFSKRLVAVAGDASYKQIEALGKAGENSAVMKKVDAFLKNYASSERVPDALTLAGGAALAAGEKKRAMGYFTSMIQTLPKSETASKAFLARAKILEERFEFASAAQDLRAFLGMPAEFTKLDAKDASKLRQKVLALGWLSGDPALIRSFLAGKDLCTGDATIDCEKYRAVSTLLDPERAGKPDVTDMAFERAHKGGGGDETRTLWAAVALAGAKKLPFRDRNVMLARVVAGWEELDPLLRIAVLPQLTISIPATVRMNREALPTIAALKADEKWIGARVDKIREVEIASAKVMKMQWSRLRADVLNETAGLYLDLAQGLAAIPAPKALEGRELEQYQAMIRKLVLPFEEKGQEMRGKAFEVASQSAVEEATLAAVSEAFFAENPSQAKALRQPAASQLGFAEALGRSGVRPGELTPALMDKLEPSVNWSRLLRSPESAGDDEGLMLRARWAQAVGSKNWMQMAFFLQEAQSRKLVAGGPLAAFRAITLAAAGARAEGLADLASHLRDFPSGSAERKIAAATVGNYYQKTFAYDKARGFASELEEPKAEAIAEAPAAAPAGAPAKAKRKKN